MNAPPASSSDPKDFLDQLRSVHFTLLAVCLAAVVIVSSPSPTRIIMASGQLDQIIAVTAKWNANWVIDSAEALANNHPECKGEASLYLKIGSRKFRAAIERKWDVRYNVPEVNVSFAGTAPASLPAPQAFGPSVPAPTTLGQFRAIWDSEGKLLCPPTTDFHLRTGDTVDVRYTPDSDFWHSPGQHIEVFTPSESEKLEFEPAKEFVWVVTEHLPPGPVYGIESRPQTALIQVHDDPQEWTIPTGFGPGGFDNIDVRSEIIAALKDNGWQPAESPKGGRLEFQKAFPELNHVATSEAGAFNYAFADLKSSLERQRNSAEEAFEAFGIKFPIYGTTRWAVSLIVAIQAYFWLHLNEYSRRDFARADMAWIGIYTGWSARIVSSVTMLVIPVLVVLLLCIQQGLAPLEPRNNTILGFLAVTSSAALAALTAYTYSRISKRREKPS